MKLTNKELKEIYELHSQKYISLNEHPLFPNVRIATYTSKAEIEEIWDEHPIIRRCRGLVFDELNGRIIINCIPKFFNIDTKFSEKIDINDPLTIITEKNDGYLIQICFDKRYGLIVTSKSSFTSKYAEYVFDKVKDEINFDTNISYICELCKDFPGDEGIIVTRHPKEKIVCFAIRDSDGKEDIEAYIPDCLEEVEMFDSNEAKEYLKGKVEGVVLYNRGKRVKMKTEWFFLMHKTIANCTKKHAFELFSEGISLEKVEIPDEFLPKMIEWTNEFKRKYNVIEATVDDELEYTKEWTDKDIALDNNLIYKSILFNKRKNKDYRKLIIREIKDGESF